MVRLVYNPAPAMEAESPVNPTTKVDFDFWHDNGLETKKSMYLHPLYHLILIYE